MAEPERSFHNPFWPHSFADPFVLKTRGRYYAYGTEDAEHPEPGSEVFPILASPDLVHWRACGRAMPALGVGYFRYWAPEVVEHNGRYLLYYAVHTEPFRAAIRVAAADRPEGPFLDTGHDLTGALFDWAIDPHVFRDDDGRWYLFYTVEYTEADGELVGSGNVVDRLRDPFTAEGRPGRVTRPGHPWQLFEAGRAEKAGMDWYCVEGPSVLKHRGRYFQLYSGGCYYGDNYAVSYAVSSQPLEPCDLRDDAWQDQSRGGERLLMRGEHGAAISPGHNSVVLAPNNVDLYIVYHAWPGDMRARLPYLDRLYWHGDDLWTGAPTTGPQPAPTRPRLEARFESGIRDGWEEVGDGCWRGEDAAVAQIDDRAGAALLVCTEPLGSAWLLCVSVRHLVGGGCYGIRAFDSDGTGVQVLIDPVDRVVALVERSKRPRGRAGGGDAQDAHPRWDGPAISRATEDASLSGDLRAAVPLPTDIDPAAWQQLLIAGCGEVLSVRLNGQPLLSVRHPVPIGQMALATSRCGAAFTGVALTDHFHDDFVGTWSPDELGWHAAQQADMEGAASPLPGQQLHAASDAPQPPSGMGDAGTGAHSWRVEDGTLRQRAEAGEQLIYKDLSLPSMECGATFWLPPASAPSGAAIGVAGWYERRRPFWAEMVWELGCWWLLVGGDPAPSHPCGDHEPQEPPIERVELPRNIDPATPHTLRIVWQSGKFAVSLDGMQRCVLVLSPGPAALALYTRRTAASFRDVWQTGLPA